MAYLKLILFVCLLNQGLKKKIEKLSLKFYFFDFKVGVLYVLIFC